MVKSSKVTAVIGFEGALCHDAAASLSLIGARCW